LTSTTALKTIADLINDTTTRNLPKDATLYGCTECLVIWINEEECWCCAKPATKLAEPLERDGLQLAKPRNVEFLSANHFISNQEFGKYLKERYRCVSPDPARTQHNTDF